MAKKAAKKKSGSVLGPLLAAGVVILLIHSHAKVPHASTSLGTTDIVATSDFQSCVISRESGGNPSIWNKQGYPYWGLYQFGKPLWVANGGNPSDWGRSSTSASEQTQVFNSVMSHYKGCENWTPSDGCPNPLNGCS